MRDFDKRWDEFNRDFDRAKRSGRRWAMVLIPLYLIGAVLILGILAVALYGLGHYVGLW